MDKDQKFPEQTAPEKNTDNAFVQVGEDGSPVIPPTNETQPDTTQENETNTIDKR